MGRLPTQVCWSRGTLLMNSLTWALAQVHSYHGSVHLR